MDDYCFRKIKSSALVMIALVAVHIAISRPLGYYWNALQAGLSGVELTVKGVPEASTSSQGLAVYILLFGVIAALAFITSPRRTNIFYRLILLVPLSVYLYSAYMEYEKISPVSEKFKDLYESLEYAIFIPYAAIAAFTALYLILVIALPAFRVTQAFGWATSVVAILSYLASAVFIVYNHTMTILEGKFGEGEFYIYLVAFALDVASYFFMLSVLMTYCMIKREERWDRLEAIELALERAAEIEEEEAEERAFYEPPAPSAYLGERVIPDIEDLREHEIPDVMEWGARRRVPDAVEVNERSRVPDAVEVNERRRVPDAVKVNERRRVPDAVEVNERSRVPDAVKVNEQSRVPDVMELKERGRIPGVMASKEREQETPGTEETEKVEVEAHEWVLPDAEKAAPEAAPEAEEAEAEEAEAREIPDDKSGKESETPEGEEAKEDGTFFFDDDEWHRHTVGAADVDDAGFAGFNFDGADVKEIKSMIEESSAPDEGGKEDVESEKPADSRDSEKAPEFAGEEEKGKNREPDASQGKDEKALDPDDYREEKKEAVVADRTRRNNAGDQERRDKAAPARKGNRRRGPREKK